MPLQLLCECGKQLNLPDEHAGRRVQCPGCGRSHQVPTSAESVSTPLAQAAEPAPARSGCKKVGLLLGLIGVLLGAAAAWWFFFHKAGPPVPEKEGDDLALIPGNAQGFLSTRLADLWKAPATQRALEGSRKKDPEMEDPAAQLERETGLKPTEVERFTIVYLDAERKIGWALVRTLQPYAAGKILEQLRDHKEVQYKSERYHLGTKPVLRWGNKPLAIHFAGTHVLVAGSEDGVKRCIDFSTEKPAEGPLTLAITLAGGKHTAVAGFVPKGLSEENLAAIPALQLLPEVKPILKTGAEARLITATVDVSDKSKLEAKAEFPTEEKAKKAKDAIDKNKKGIRGKLWLRSFIQDDQGKAAAALYDLLGKAKFEQSGKDVTVKANLGDGSMVDLSTLLRMLDR